MHQFIHKIWERNDKVPLDYQVFNKICILLFIFSLFGFAQSLFIKQPFFISILFLITSILGVFLFWLSNFKNYYKASKFIFTLFLYFFSILGWFFNAGINGSTVLFFLAINIYIIGFYKKNYLPLLSLNIGIYAILVVIGYLNPEFIQFTYLNEVDHVFDMTTSYLMIVVSIFIVMRTIMKNFNHSRDVIVAQKITQEMMNADLKKSKKIVEIRESYLNSLINNRDEGIWTIDTNYNFNIFNNYYEDAYLKTFKKKVYKGLNSLSYLDPESTLLWKSKYDQALSGKKIVFDFLNYEDKNHLLYKVSLNPIFLDGEIIGASGLSVNITDHHNTENALKESEEKLKAILKTIPDYIFHFNKKGIFINFYQENKDQNLLKDPKEFINKSLTEIFEKELANSIQEKITETLQTGSSDIEYSMQMDGLKYFEARFSFLNKNEVIASVRDITDRKKVNNALKVREAELEELNTSKDKLFSIIAHDLRSPFNHILGFSDLLVKNGDKYDAEKNKKYLSIINSSAKNTLNLLDNLLNWAKSQTGRIELNPQKISLSTVIEELISDINPEAKFKNIALNYIQTNDVEVCTDVDLLKTILRNLISNAIKFTEEQGEIIVSAIKKQNHIEIMIADNGVGMSAENCKKLFKTSTNTSSRGTANEKGSGLGLVLCKEFVEKLGGTIWVESELGKGSVFKFTLPL